MEVVKLHNSKPCDDPNNVLEHAMGSYEDVLIIGYDKEGSLDIRSTSSVTAERALFLIEQFKNNLLNGEYCE